MTADTKNIRHSGNNRFFAFGLLLLFIMIYLFPLDNRPLAIPDETRYASIPYEMLLSGDWVTPHLNGLRYFEKPPLGYWLNAMSLAVFGENNFAVRFPSAVAAGLTTLLVYLFTAKIMVSRRTALIAAFIYMTFFEVYAIGVYSTLDGMLTFFLTAGIISFYLGSHEQGKGKNKRVTAWLYWIVSGISLGLAFLTKGFLALAIPVIVLLPWLIWHRHWHLLFVKGSTVVLIAVMVALPWGIIIHLREADFWHYFFWIEHIKRFTADNAQHKAPFFYFLMYLPIVAFPWISLLPAAFKGLKKDKKQTGSNTRVIATETRHILWLWLIIPLLFFSASSGKLITYILPCFPPLAILTAVGLSQYLAQQNTRLFSWGVLFNLLLLALLLTVIVISQLVDVGFSVYQQGESLKFMILLSGLLTGIISGIIAYRSTSTDIRLLMAALMIAPVIALMHFAVPDISKESKSPGTFISQFREGIDSNTIIISDSAMLRALNWYLKRDDVYIVAKGEVAYGLGYPDAQHRYLNPQRFSTLLKNSGSKPIMLFCRKSCPEPIMELIPDHAEKFDYGKFHAWSIR